LIKSTSTFDVDDASTFPRVMVGTASTSTTFTADLSGGAIITVSWTPGSSSTEKIEVTLDDVTLQGRSIQGSTSTLYYPDGRWGWSPPYGCQCPMPFYTEVFEFDSMGIGEQEHTFMVKAINGDGLGFDAILFEALEPVPEIPEKLGSYHWDDALSKGSSGVKYWYEDADGDDVADYLYLEFHVTYFGKEDHSPGWLGYFIVDNGFSVETGTDYKKLIDGNYEVTKVWGKMFLKGPYEGTDTYFDTGVNEPSSGFLWHGDCWGATSRADQAFVFADIDGANHVQKGMKLLFTSTFKLPADYHSAVGFHLRTGYPSSGSGPVSDIIVGSI
ncbi:MAG: hypothetical protein KAW09_04970, partial [Thermoplasmata archaeon]|nr:hypothetical protein [Thermoplasmata archaeon]